MISGSCLCKEIQFEITTTPKQINLCHCQMCQKFSGSAFGSFMRVSGEGFRFIKGQDKIRVYNSSEWAARSFCADCGSSIGYINKNEPGLKFVAAGTLDNSPGINVHHHIFTKEKASWYHINEDIPQFTDWRSSVPNDIE